MAVTLFGNRPVDLNTWTAQSIKEIEKLTKAGGVTNHVKAMGQVIKLQGGAIGDTASYSWAAVKAIPSLEMSLLIQNVKLALKHAIQAGLTLPGVFVPRLVLTTTQFLDIKGKDLPKGWQDQAKALATQVRDRGADFVQKGVDLAKKVQANPNAMLAIKVGAGLVALGLSGLVVNRFMGGSTPSSSSNVSGAVDFTNAVDFPNSVDVVTRWGAKEMPSGLIQAGAVGAIIWKKDCLSLLVARDTCGASGRRDVPLTSGDYLYAEVVIARGEKYFTRTVNVGERDFTLVNIRGDFGYYDADSVFVKGEVNGDQFTIKTLDAVGQLKITETVVADQHIYVALRDYLLAVLGNLNLPLQEVIAAKQKLLEFCEDNKRPGLENAVKRAEGMPDYQAGLSAADAQRAVTDHDGSDVDQAITKAERMPHYQAGLTVEDAQRAVADHDRADVDQAFTNAERMPNYKPHLTVEDAQRAVADHDGSHVTQAITNAQWMPDYQAGLKAGDAQQAVDAHDRTDVTEAISNAESMPDYQAGLSVADAQQAVDAHDRTDVNRAISNAERMPKYRPGLSVADAQRAVENCALTREEVNQAFDAARAMPEFDESLSIENARRELNRVNGAIGRSPFAILYAKAILSPQAELPKGAQVYAELLLWRSSCEQKLAAAEAFNHAEALQIQEHKDYLDRMNELAAARAYEAAQLAARAFDADHQVLVNRLLAAEAYGAAQLAARAFDADHQVLVNRLAASEAYEAAQLVAQTFEADHWFLENQLVAAEAFAAAKELETKYVTHHQVLVSQLAAAEACEAAQFVARAFDADHQVRVNQLAASEAYEAAHAALAGFNQDNDRLQNAFDALVVANQAAWNEREVVRAALNDVLRGLGQGVIAA